jgi:hypothetical protein
VAPDLKPLERAAERVGLPGMRAFIVPADPRRGTWFRWDQGAGELAVSERVIERCPPDDAAALLINEVLLARRLGGLKRGVRLGVLATGAAVTGSVVMTAGGDTTSRAIGIAMLILLPMLCLIFWLSLRTKAAFETDDETVRLLGDAEPLVRGLNRMNQDELVVGRFRSAARPDLHRRAERLVAMHQLCSAPTAASASPQQEPPTGSA